MLPLNQIQCKDNLVFLRSLPDACVDLVVTDPPYNVSQAKDMKFQGSVIVKNFGDWDFDFDPAPVLKELKRVLKPDGQIYIFCGTKQIPLYMKILETEWFFRNLLIWYKTNPAPRLSKFNFTFACEYIIYGINEKVKTNTISFDFSSQSTMHNVFITTSLRGKERLKGSDGKASHPTQKPLSILKKLILTSSKPGDIVLDVFMGVGSTAVACKETGRNFLGCEINQNYVALANKRLENNDDKTSD
jgi:DNA modification methylase